MVFNCTEAVNLTCLGHMMKGMATTGAWVLLDNFHALRRVVTSTLAMQALALRTALLQGKTEVILDGTLLSPIEKSFGMHVSSTPGLDSTHPLPEDLKVRVWEGACFTVGGAAEGLLHGGRLTRSTRIMTGSLPCDRLGGARCRFYLQDVDPGGGL